MGWSHLTERDLESVQTLHQFRLFLRTYYGNFCYAPFVRGVEPYERRRELGKVPIYGGKNIGPSKQVSVPFAEASLAQDKAPTSRVECVVTAVVLPAVDVVHAESDFSMLSWLDEMVHCFPSKPPYCGF